MNELTIAKIQSYYSSRGQIGTKILSYPDLTYYNLLAAIPNNKRKMMGLPTARRARRYKKVKHERWADFERVWGYPYFELLEKAINELLKDEFSNDFIDQFIDVKTNILGECYDKSTLHSRRLSRLF